MKEQFRQIEEKAQEAISAALKAPEKLRVRLLCGNDMRFLEQLR